MSEFNDYRDLTDEQARDILNEFIHMEFFDRRNDDIGKAIVRAIVMFEGRIEADKHCKSVAETIKDMHENAVRRPGLYFIA